MEKNELSYRELRRVQQLEKNSPTLSKITPEFYENLLDYLQSLNSRLEKEKSSQKQMILRDEIENTKKIAFNIYEIREKKILLAAISKARGGSPNINNLSDEEKNVFDDVLNVLLDSRKKVFEDKENNQDHSEERQEEKEDKIENNEKGEKPKNLKSKDLKKNKNPVIRVIRDVPEFMGENSKKYHLKKNDVLSLSDDLVEILEKRKMVEKIDKLL